MLPFNLDVTTFLPAGLDFFGGFGAAGLGNLMTLVLAGVFGLYCVRFLVEALVAAATGSRLVGSMAGTAAFVFAGYLALVKVALPMVTAWFDSLLAPLNAMLSMY